MANIGIKAAITAALEGGPLVVLTHRTIADLERECGCPAPMVDVQPRCILCGHMLAYRATRPWRILCTRCKTVNSK